MSTSALSLISHPLCPYVQRAAIVLLEKGIPFDRINVDLSAKPAWFLAMSPTSKVPLLQIHGGDGSHQVLFESMAICEYLDETQRGAPLHPSDPGTRSTPRLDRVRVGDPGRCLGLFERQGFHLSQHESRGFQGQARAA